MSGYWGNDGSARSGIRRRLRTARERDRKLTIRHRWFAGGVATLLSGALIFTGVTPAIAEVVPPPVDQTTAAATPSAEDAATPPAEETTPPAEESTPPAEVTTPPADETPAEPTPVDPAPAPSDPAPAPSEPAPAPSETTAPDDVAPTEQTQSRVAPPADVAPFSLLAECSGSCLTITRNVTVSGGTATAADWEYRATDGADWHVIPNGAGGIDVGNGDWVISAVSLNANTANYDTSVTCTDTGGGLDWDSSESTLSYTSRSDRSATCSFTQTYRAPGTITIQKGGLRTGAQTVAGLQGATFEVYKGGSSSAPDTAPANLIDDCVTAANGQCTVSVPGGAQYWIIEKSAPAGWSMITQMYADSSNTAYRFRTDTIASGSNTTYPKVGTGDGATASSGYWANVLNNPSALQACGIRVGLLIDLSNSIDGTELGQLKTAANGFVDALQGTPSSLAVWTFATSAPASGGANGKLNLTSVSTPAGASAVKSKINGLTQPGGDAGATNWDQGLWQVANDAANKVDVLLMLTDGTPTVYGPSADGPGSYSRFREVETSVFSANAVKNLGTRVVPVGIGVEGAEVNIKAISGPTINSDYYLVSNYSALAAFLQNLAKGQCDSTINVTKMVVPAGGTIANATPTPNWGFGATSGNPVTPANGTTNGSGAISFKVSGLTSGQNAAVTITEENRAGYTVIKQGGKNAVCKNDAGQDVTVTDAGALGFTANATGGKIVTCTVYNQAPNPQVKLKVVKKWVINDVPYDNDDPARPFGSASLTLTGNPGAVFGDEYTYNVGTSVTIGESVSGLPPFCTNSSAGTGQHTMVASPNPNVVTVTNTVTCTTQLKLSKKVQGGDAAPSLWALKGTGPGGSLAGPTGNGPATSLVSVTPGSRYVLSESGGDPRYTQEVAPNAVPVPGATGSWHCYVLNADGTRGSEGAGGLNGWVEVQLGQHVDCEAVNQTASLVLLKHVVNDHGGTEAASAWDLTATPAALTGLTATTVDGAETPSAANTIQVRPNHVYTISETGPTGYQKVKLQKLVSGSWVDVAGWDVSVPPNGSATYRVVNDDIAPRLTLVKQVTNDNGGTTPNTAWTLTATTEDGPNLSGATGTTGEVVANESYTLAESTVPGYAWASLSCTNGHNATKADPTLTLKPGENVTCTFTNDDQPGKLTLVKVVDASNGGTAVPSDWNQKLTAKRGGDSALSFNHNETKNVPAGVYTLAEINQITGYEWTNLVCSTGQTSMDAKTVTVANGANVTCTFTNRAIKPTLTLVKHVDNKNGAGSATPGMWTLTAAADGQPSVTGNGTASGTIMPGAEYILSESDNVSGYTAGDWGCYVTGSDPHVAFPIDDDTIVPLVGKDVTCEITNTAVPAEGGVVKKVRTGSPEQIATGADAGKWRIVYDITVTNESRASTLFYSLSDTLQLGAGITASTATWSGPSGTTGGFTLPAGTATLATDRSLAPQTNAAQPLATHVYTVTVIADVAPSAAAADTSVCTSTQPKRAFLNSATLTIDGIPTTVQDCAQPVFPTIVKVGANPASQNPDASWNVKYTITVGNPSATTAVQATLSDAFPAAPAGWTLSSGTWTVTAVGSAPAPAASPYAPGAAPIWQGTLPANAAYSYTVTGTLVPSSTATPIGDCAAQAGFKNKATVTSGQVVKDATGCVSVVLPPVQVFKADGAVTQLADGTWQIDYAIEVQNTSETTSTVYTLTDTPDLGSGFTPAGPGTWRDPADHGTEVAAPAANTPIGLKGTAEGTHTYVYRVLASFDPEVEDPQLECVPGRGGAFHNVAEVTFPGGADEDDACAEPGAPTVTKTASAPAPGAGGSWSLTYTVVVSNTSGMALAYTLEDVPFALPTGVNLSTAWAVSGPAKAPADAGDATLTAGWDGGAQPQVATGTIPSGATHTYTVTAGVTLTTGVDPDVLACGESPAENDGMWNTTVVTNGVFEDSDEDCIEVLPVPVEVQKSDGTASQGESGVWTIAYTVTVSNPNPLPSVYTLTDTPEFDAALEILTQGWAGSPDTTDVPIAADATGAAAHTYTYVVTAKSKTDPAPPTALKCDQNGGGFYNVATVTFPGGTDSDSGCGIPAKPAVNKVALPSTQNPVTGEWTLRYAVSVTNTSGLPLWYSAKDTPAALPLGAIGGTWQVLAPTLSGGGSAVVNPQWNGDGVLDLATGLIPSGATHTFTLSRTVRIPASIGDGLLDCQSEDGGLWNRTAVTNGIGGNDAEACAQVDRPAVEIDKSVTGTRQLEDGTWEITYDVVVTNTSDELAAVYSLDDALEFGGDIDIEDASWTGPSGSGDFAGPAWSATLATDHVLAPRVDAAGVDTYTVTVHATIDAAAWDGDTLACQDDEGPVAGGFLNTATVTVNGEPITDDDCAEPKLPTFQKVGVSATQDEDDATRWLVTYQLRVTGSGYDTFYSLSDTPAFADGITVISGEAQRTDIDPAGPEIPVTAGTDFVTDEALGAADEPHVYTITWLVDIADTFDPDRAACDGEGTGFFNTALLSIGEIEVPGEDCIPVEDRVYPVPTKTVTSTTQDPETGDWTIVYEIDVALAAEGPQNPKGLSAEYDLEDELAFGGDINVGSAEWTGPSDLSPGTFSAPDQPAQLAEDEKIDAGETDTYVVTVVASVTDDAIEGDTTRCVSGEGPSAGGFLNTALLSSGGTETPVDACSEPVFPEIEKHGGATTDNGDGTWDIEYFVTVSYPESDSDPLAGSVAYDLTDAPALPAGVELDGDWAAEAADEATPDPTDPTWDGSGTWTVVDGGELTPEAGVHTYRVFATVDVTAPPTGELGECSDAESAGILILNVGTITSGDYVADDEGCQVVHFDDVGIEKTAVLAEGEESVEPGDTFSYELTVTNHGTRPATDVQVTDDDLNDRLDILGLAVSPAEVTWHTAPGWTENGGDQSNDVVDLTLDSLGVADSAVITIEVEFLPYEQEAVFYDHDGNPETPDIEGLPPLVGDQGLPEIPEPVDLLENTACVAMDGDGVEENNCDTAEVPARDLVALVYTRCVNDAPFLGWAVTKSQSLADLPIDLVWKPDNADVTPQTSPAQVAITQPGGSTTWSDEISWPGSVFTPPPSSISIDYPGWRALEASDVVPGSIPTQYYLPGTNVVMTAAQEADYVFNGLILDPSELDFAWRGVTDITFTVNPTLEYTTAYPPATPACFVARHTDVQVDKQASVERTEPGKSFSYTLDVSNVSEDSAAESVVVTDVIPADIKVTEVNWPGKGDADAFPNWQSCEVTGQNGAGYGGTLECVLYGPLQPVNAGNGGASTAPRITLSATVSPSSKANTITNVAVVDYHTFGDPDDPGRDTDDATVLLSALPATGGSSMLPLVLLGLVVMLTGAAVVMISRRRRGEARPRL